MPVDRITPSPGGLTLDQAVIEGRVSAARQRVRVPTAPRIRGRGSVSDLVAEQRR
jgi:hypothetical protein